MASVTERLNLRITASDRALFDRAAEAGDESLTQFLVTGGRERAERLLADRRVFFVDDVDWEALAEAMDRPAEPNPALTALFSRSRPD